MAYDAKIAAKSLRKIRKAEAAASMAALHEKVRTEGGSIGYVQGAPFYGRRPGMYSPSEGPRLPGHYVYVPPPTEAEVAAALAAQAKTERRQARAQAFNMAVLDLGPWAVLAIIVGACALPLLVALAVMS